MKKFLIGKSFHQEMERSHEAIRDVCAGQYRSARESQHHARESGSDQAARSLDITAWFHFMRGVHHEHQRRLHKNWSK